MSSHAAVESQQLPSVSQSVPYTLQRHCTSHLAFPLPWRERRREREGRERRGERKEIRLVDRMGGKIGGVKGRRSGRGS